jgi:hypothetical protein
MALSEGVSDEECEIIKIIVDWCVAFCFRFGRR